MTGEPTGDTQRLGRTAARGSVSTLAGQLARATVQAISLVVLARLLLPEDFGLVAMVAAVVRIGDVVRESGLANAAIQATTLSDEQRDNLFWLNTVLGCATGAALFFLAPLVAGFYGEPALVEITRWLALTFVLSGIATQYGASLVRDMRFAAAATIEVVAQVAGLVAAIVIALIGGAYWALVGQNLAIALVICVGSAAAAGWLPGLPHRDVSIRPLVGYGLHLLASQLIEQTCRAADTIVVGFRFGAVSAGLYNRAFQLMALPMRQLTYPAQRVALTVLARLQDDKDTFWPFVLRGQTILLHALTPVCSLAAALAPAVVDIVLGPSWAAAAPVLSLLMVAAIFETASQPTTWVLLSTGRTRALFVFTLVTRPVLLVAIVGGSFLGLAGVAGGVAASAVVIWLAGLVWIRRTNAAPAGRLFGAALRAVAAHGIAAASGGLAAARLDLPGPWAEVGVGLGVAVATLGVLALAWPQLRRDLSAVLRSARLLRHPQASDQRREAHQ
ncbi:lipopolysaccharide biosynthesis protein [Isoptericola sp. NEAU-Y5]|uniref:Lipopolysaccharide biosynthesis protein n=1 Tax=Isoptericola luteus TaxID=2879484 RepID=A0ABS7ZD90_9MICO|nr:lipopolysaccharide biosynthesis protein [Isoptericola sp. NEAU-Y5]MCA5893005.1 lipopolysaccharide biosynthesis protein [Isoptericola sp. NEAU-Y5]